MKTDIMFILDRSGSMQSCAANAVEGFNKFLLDQQKSPKGKRLSLLQFDNEFDYTYKSKKLKNCAPLILNHTYQPRGSTALLDAIGKGVNDIKRKQAVIAIYTDGFENSSQEFTQEQISKLLKKVQEKKGWEVIFLASDMTRDVAITMAASMGIKSNKTAVVGKSARAFAASMDTLSTATEAYQAKGSASNLDIQDEYDKKLKEKEGDSATT